jgi:CRISPR-associated protein Cmr4
MKSKRRFNMFKKSKLFFIIAETPLHPGSGGDSTGIVDLPIQRERYTNFPKIEASGLKGCIREAFRNSNKQISLNSHQINVNDTKIISLVFGPEDAEEAFASAISFTDARILLFPVKSLKGVFAWITCPMVLERFKEEMRLTGQNILDENVNILGLTNTVTNVSTLCIDSKIVLEEYTFAVSLKEETKKISQNLASKIFPTRGGNDIYKFWREKLEKDLVILSDDDFEQFVTSSTEVITRTKIDDKTGTVQSGALWTEEYLPQDTILYSLAMASPVRVEKDEAKEVFKAETPDKEAEKVLQFFELGIPEVIQIGGNQTIGKGFVKIQILR